MVDSMAHFLKEYFLQATVLAAVFFLLGVLNLVSDAGLWRRGKN
jgi:hypothetical protein